MNIEPCPKCGTPDYDDVCVICGTPFDKPPAPNAPMSATELRKLMYEMNSRLDNIEDITRDKDHAPVLLLMLIVMVLLLSRGCS